MMAEPALFTCSYSEFQTSMGTPVRTSNGHPRWKLGYKIEHVCRDLMPNREWMELPAQDFDARYRMRLNEVGADTLAQQFVEIASMAKGDRLVLLCFEQLPTGKECHRTTFANWWQEATGEPVHELGGPAPKLFTI